MPQNHELRPSQDNPESFQIAEPEPEKEQAQEDQEAERGRKLGAEILSRANFGSRYDIVDSSFQQAKKHGEKLPGKNGERRTFAYLSRLESLFERKGKERERKLWQVSAQKDLLIREENIPESYWDALRQAYRDAGAGNVVLTNEAKHEHFLKERQLQKESLERWANYLGDEQSPYPLWFKIYAWDGMTKMGKYDRVKKKYATRNETTVAPYPEPNAEILTKVFEVINRYYGNGEKDFYTEEGARNIDLEKAVASGNFVKIYNSIQQEITPNIEPPAETDDVHGEWVEYVPGDEYDIARAAIGTGWCIGDSSAVARHYLKFGTYGTDEDEEYDDEEEYDEGDNGARFILFHLQDQSTGLMAKSACASIRLDPGGKVAEISGLKPGQALNDSLVPIVEEKVKTLPGGEEFLPKFYCKKKLIALDRKMQANEDLTVDELEFLYEINEKIQTVDTYNARDPRIGELRNRYNIEYAVNHGIDTNRLIETFNSPTIQFNLELLVEHGANVDRLAEKLSSSDICSRKNLEYLVEHGANIDMNELIKRLKPQDICKKLDYLIENGANIDINELVEKTDPHFVGHYLRKLVEHGADVNKVVGKLHPESIVRNLDYLIEHGADININELVDKLSLGNIIQNLEHLIEHGADINIDELVERSDPNNVAYYLEQLVELGADINKLTKNLKSLDICVNLEYLIEHGASINMDELIERLDKTGLVQYRGRLIDNGADANRIQQRIQELVQKYGLFKHRRQGSRIGRLHP